MIVLKEVTVGFWLATWDCNPLSDPIRIFVTKDKRYRQGLKVCCFGYDHPIRLFRFIKKVKGVKIKW